MNTKTHRAPVALALAALFAASLVPASGASAQTPFYESIAEPGAPAWRITKLHVTEPDVKPTLQIQLTDAVCPLTWRFQFLVGSPEAARVHYGHGFALGGGSAGAAVDAGDVHIERDEQSQCASNDVWTFEFRALPVGTVYLLETRSGSHFGGWARIDLSGPGVEKVATSVGYESVLVGSDDFQGGTHVAAANPGVCFLPRSDGACDWAWRGGSQVNVDVGSDRSVTASFQHHPWFSFQHLEDSSVGNISMTDPLGGVTFAGGEASLAGLSVNPRGFHGRTIGLPAGDYTFRIETNVDASSVSWWATWFDLEFPEEQGA